jgi:hypothetical protein
MKLRSVRVGQRRAVAAVLLAIAVCTASAGCGAGRTAAHAADDVAHVPRPHVEVPVPHAGGGAVNESSVAARKAEILSSIEDMSTDDRRTAIEVACRFKSRYDLSQIEDDEELVYKAALEFGGDATKGARVVVLAHDLYSADDPADAVGQTAAAYFCGP